MGCLLCCVVSEVFSCTHRTCKCFCPTSRIHANVAYLCLFCLMALLAFVMQHWGAPNVDLYSYNIGCTDIPGIDVSACKGEQAAYRICIGTTIWFTILAIGSRFSDTVHDGLWLVKCVGLVALVVGLFFVPMLGQYGYIQCARIISTLFLVAQIVSFIDLAYTWNNNLVNRRLFNVVLGLCALLALTIAVMLVIFFVHYANCERQTVFIALTLIVIVLFTALQLNTSDTENSLLTSCIVALYCTYLCWSAVSADTCNDDDSSDAQLVVGAMVTIVSLAWTCYTTGKSQSNSLFHVVFAIGTVYVSMLLTNWGTIAGMRSEVRMWVTIASQWTVCLVYVWTILAPKWLPDRDFHIVDN